MSDFLDPAVRFYVVSRARFLELGLKHALYVPFLVLCRDRLKG